MQTEVRHKPMQISITQLAKEYKIVPGQIFALLQDLGVSHDYKNFEADQDVLELLKESIQEIKDTKKITLEPGKTPRDIANVLGLPQPEIQKALMTKLKVMATLTTTLKPEIIEKLLGHYGYQVEWAEQKAQKTSPGAVKKAASTSGD